MHIRANESCQSLHIERSRIFRWIWRRRACGPTGAVTPRLCWLCCFYTFLRLSLSWCSVFSAHSVMKNKDW